MVQASTPPTRILIIDDDQHDIALVKAMLSRRLLSEHVQYELEALSKGPDLVRAIQAAAPDCILLDCHLGHIAGLDVLTTYRQDGGNAPVVVLTGDESIELSDQFMQQGANEHVSKNTLSASSLHRAIQYAIKSRKTDLARMEFMANIGHEIRTPMSGVIGMLDLLGLSQLDAKQREYVALAQRSADALTDILNDLLDVAKLAHGRVELNERSYQPATIIADVVQLFSSQAEQQSIQLSSAVEDAAFTLFGDPDRFRQVLSNLVGNAVKFTRHGSVRVHASLSHDVFQVKVVDTGVGIEAENVSGIFEAFAQADKTVSSNYGGTGLGLSISKQLCRLMGGTISLHSELGVGSEFTVQLPVSNR